MESSLILIHNDWKWPFDTSETKHPWSLYKFKCSHKKRKDGNDKLQITCAISQLILFYSILMVSGLAWNICMPVTILGEFKIPFFTFLKPWYNTTYKMNPKWLKMKYTLFLRFTEHSLKKRKVTKDTFVTYVFKEKMKHPMT